MKKTTLILLTLMVMLFNSSLFLSAEENEMQGNYITLTKKIKEHEDLISLNPYEYSLMGSEYEVRNSNNEVVAIFEIAENGVGFNKMTGKPFVDQLDDGLYKIKEIKPSKGFVLDEEVYEVYLYADTHLPKQITVNTVCNIYGKNSKGEYFPYNKYILWTTDYGIGAFECGICLITPPSEINSFGRHIISTSSSRVLDRNSAAGSLIYKILYYGRKGPQMWPGFYSGNYHIPFSSRDGYSYYKTNSVDVLSAFITHAALGRAYGKNSKWQYSWNQHGVNDYYNWVIQQPQAPKDFVVYMWENYRQYKTQDMFYGVLLQPADYDHKNLVVETKAEFDPIRVVLTKRDKNNCRIKGAQFTVEYYSCQLQSAEQAKNLNPIRKWVFETDGNGIFRFSKDYLVSGDELFTVDGNAVLLAGTYLVCESKVPSGYVRAEDFMIRVSSDVTKPVEFTDSSGKGRIETSPEEGYRLLEIMEGYLTLEKESEVACHYPLSNAVYQLFADEKCTEEVYKNNSSEKAVLVTDENGKTARIALAPGRYYIKEIQAPDNFYLDLNVYEIEIRQQETVTVKSIECPKTISLKVIKTDNFSNPLQGAVFGLYSKSGELLFQKETDENGEILFENCLFVQEEYYLQEIKAPFGYNLENQKYPIDTSEFRPIIEKEIINYHVPETGDFFICQFVIMILTSFAGIFSLYKTVNKYL
ncbi:MAG: SpaA isopeptide-forming pilin-related protein [Erysipelotrichaceae bacterium]